MAQMINNNTSSISVECMVVGLDSFPRALKAQKAQLRTLFHL